jgi:hypothetical protein
MLLALHLLALPMPWLAALSWPARVGLDGMVCGLAAWQVWRWRQPVPTALRLLPDGMWAMAWAGREHEAVLLPGAYVTVHLIVLPLKLAGGPTYRLVLWPDSADRDDLRRLRAWLRWGASALLHPESPMAAGPSDTA